MSKLKKISLKKISVMLLALNMYNSAIAQEALELNNTLNYYTLENDAFYNKALAPAMSPDLNKNEASRIFDINNKISSEINSVLSAFDNSSEDKKKDAVLNVIKKIDVAMLSAATAHIIFTDGKPGVGTARTVLMFEKKNQLTPEKVLSVISSYKRSAKPNDHVYEYENPQNLTSGNIKYTKGSDASWQAPLAPEAFIPAKDYVLKKCRQVFGWKCSTILYHVDILDLPQGTINYLFTSNYDLKNNPDHQEFAGDKRSTNQTAGSTSLFVVKESAQWIIVYGVDTFLSNEKISFASIIQNEFAKDFGRLNQRLTEELQINKFEANESKPAKKPKIKFKEKIAKWFQKLMP